MVSVSAIEEALEKMEHELSEALRDYRANEPNTDQIKAWIDRYIEDNERIISELSEGIEHAVTEEKLLVARLRAFARKTFKNHANIIEGLLDKVTAKLYVYVRRAADKRFKHASLHTEVPVQYDEDPKRVIELMDTLEHEAAELSGLPLRRQLAKRRRIERRVLSRVKELITGYYRSLWSTIDIRVSFSHELFIRAHAIHVIIDLLHKSGVTYRVHDLKDLQRRFARFEHRHFHEQDLNRMIHQIGNVVKKESLAHGPKFADGAMRAPFRFKPDEFDWSQLIAIHMTQMFPHGAMIRPRMRTGFGYRDTLHFTINGPVEPVDGGLNDWSDAKFAILIPMQRFPVKRIVQFRMVDTYIHGSLKLPSGTLIITSNRWLTQAAHERHMDPEELEQRFAAKGIGVQAIPDHARLFDHVTTAIAHAGRSVQRMGSREGSWELGGGGVNTDETREQSQRIRAEIGAGSRIHFGSIEHDVEEVNKWFRNAIRWIRTTSDEISHVSSGLTYLENSLRWLERAAAAGAPSNMVLEALDRGETFFELTERRFNEAFHQLQQGSEGPTVRSLIEPKRFSRGRDRLERSVLDVVLEMHEASHQPTLDARFERAMHRFRAAQHRAKLAAKRVSRELKRS